MFNFLFNPIIEDVLKLSVLIEKSFFIEVSVVLSDTGFFVSITS